MTDGNSSRLFGHHDGDSVRLLGNAEPGAVPQAQVAIERLPLAHRKDAGGCGQASIANNDAAVVQR